MWHPWYRLQKQLLRPTIDIAPLVHARRAVQARYSLPVVWLLGKTQAGKTSVIRALTGSTAAEIGNGFQPCTRTACFYDFPVEAPVIRFLDTRGLGEVAYDPTEDIQHGESHAHLLLGVMKAADIHQDAVVAVIQAVRQRHPDWPVLIAQTGLHELYPPSFEHPRPYPYTQEPWPGIIPHDVRCALRAQRDRVGVLPGTAPVRWVPVDFTLPEDGWEPVNYGLDALWTALSDVWTIRVQELLNADPSVQAVYARAAHPHIVGYALAAAGMGTLPLAGIVGVPAIQAKLLHTLAVLYEQDWQQRTVVEFFSLLGVGIGTNCLTRLLVREAVKLVPGWGQTVGAVWGATASGTMTYALGKAASAYFLYRRQGQLVDANTLRQVYAAAWADGAKILHPTATERTRYDE